MADEEKKVQYTLLTRRNLQEYANTVRADAMSSVYGLTNPFDTEQEAISWIEEHGDKRNVYEIRDWETKSQSFSKWVFGSRWHRTTWKQDSDRKYKSDKNPTVRLKFLEATK